MTHDTEYKAVDDALEQILENGLDGLGRAVSILINEAMKMERSQALNAAPWEPTDSRTGWANGYKDKRLKTRLGRLDLKIPRVRGGVAFYPSALERGARSETRPPTAPKNPCAKKPRRPSGTFSMRRIAMKPKGCWTWR